MTTNYKKAGVDIKEGNEAVNMIKNIVEETHSANVLNGLGSFAGLYELSKMNNPVLVSGTDGVGTKLDIAIKKQVYDTVGIDCVAMCVNDVICHGAKPLFFLDYIACGKLDKNKVADLVKGISKGCTQSECALIGGETAEMPGFYDSDKYDIAGFSVGVVEKDKIINGKNIKENDVLIGIESSGLHSNGFSLVRYLVENKLKDKGYETEFNGNPLWKELLKPTKIYAKLINKLISEYEIKGIAHITGGGIFENIPRMSNKTFTYELEKKSIPVNPIFKFISDLGVSEEEMYKTFNMGVGMVLCVDKSVSDEIVNFINTFGEKGWILGRVISGGKEVCLI